MLRNYLTAALRNMVRNWLYAAINIVGLAVGLTAVLLVALFVRDELNYDRWIPGHDRTYLITQIRPEIFTRPVQIDGLFFDFRAPLTEWRAVEAVARLSGNVYGLRHGDVEASEEIWWADSDIFRVLPFPVYAGNVKEALDSADGMIVTRSLARKYFGRDDVVGETLEINRSFPMTIRAVLEDIPPNTHFSSPAILSVRSSFSPDHADIAPIKSSWIYYVRRQPGYSDQRFRADFDAFVKRQSDPDLLGVPEKPATTLLVPLADVHFSELMNRGRQANGSRAVVAGAAAIGLLTLAVAVLNFVNLMTAWAARRASEVGIRKVSGARRRHLIVQFIGEALLYVTFATVLAVAAAWVLSPGLQAFMERSDGLPYLKDPEFIFGIAIFAVGLAIVAGAYPAFVLSVFRPARVLKAGAAFGSGSVVVRRLLTMAQFAMLIGLTLGAVTVHHQLRFALNEALRIPTDQVLTVDSHCRDAFKDQVRALPGVRGAVCGEARALTTGTLLGTRVILRDGSTFRGAVKTSVGPGFFDFYGLRPLVGRLIPERAGDEMPYVPSIKDRGQPSVIVINETGIKAFGFESAAAAIGQVLTIPGSDKDYRAEIVGVVPDFNLDTIGKEVSPTYFFADPFNYTGLNIRLTGRDIPETLAAIDRLWKEFGEPKPIMRRFLDHQLQQFVADVIRQEQLFTGLTAVAVFIACLGLFGLSAFTAELRTKEIGVRKAMGAGQGDILRMLVWEFAKPVLWANAIAWPLGYLAMRRWLEGFAHHVDLAPWMFLAASGAALCIAIATVVGHALTVARAEPVAALRYE